MSPIKSYTNKHGRTVHYDEAGNKVGVSYRSPSSGRIIHYDAEGNETGRSYGNISGRMTHYDASGDRVGTSYTAYPGRVRHYDGDGHRTGDTYPGFWGSVTRRNDSSISATAGQQEGETPSGSAKAQSDQTIGLSKGCSCLVMVFVIIGLLGLIGALIRVG